MDYESWLTWLAQFDRRMSFHRGHLREALPDLTGAVLKRYIQHALNDGRIRRMTYSNSAQRFQLVRDVSTGGRDGRG
jgi:hypothetical protein